LEDSTTLHCLDFTEDITLRKLKAPVSQTKEENWPIMKERLRQLIHGALEDAFRAGALTSNEIPEIQIEVPANSEHGDFASNIAMVMARAEKKAPVLIAGLLVEALKGSELFMRVEVAGPGFINFTLTPSCWFEVLEQIHAQGPNYGTSNVGQGRRVQVEFVSANPTGPLHIGHGRGAAIGDAVSQLLAKVGYDVCREYYINDAGNQVVLLGRSILQRARELQGQQVDFPEDGYQGQYIYDIAKAFLNEQKDLTSLSEDEKIKLCIGFGVQYVLNWLTRDLEAFGVHFDNWYSEQSLYDNALVEKELAKLQDLGLTYEKEGALWFRTTDYGDDKDRVLVRSDGSPTYFASDVAYHMVKFERGFETLIDVWGADHHGYVPRMKAVLAGLGHAPEDLEILMIQMVNLLRAGKPVAMGKRSGEFVSLREVIDEVGRDACRFFFLMRRSDSQLDFDLELAKQKSAENPVYYVQYAHARVCSINRNAKELGVHLPENGKCATENLHLDEELAITKLLARYPDTVVGAALNYEPHRIVYYLQELASQFHSYYNRFRVLTDEVNESLGRLYLVNSVRIVLENALNLLGVTAPEQM
jgi:arginyl-tRNA synthetase